MLTDTHVHLDLDEFAADLPEVLSRSRAQGVSRWIVPAIASAHWPRLATLHGEHPTAFYALGLHPWFLGDESEQALERLAQLLRQRPAGLVAVGECGLDGAIEVPLAQQLPWFERQIQLADEFNLPLIVHCRRCYNEVLALLSRHRPRAGGVLHGFSGSRQQAEQFWALGFYLGIGGTITYERAQKTRRAVAALPLEALLLETDAPDMPLNGFQGQPNRPEQAARVFDVLCELRPEPAEAIAEALYHNTTTLFTLEI